MYCQKCGQVLPEDAKFCVYCGAAVQASPASPLMKIDLMEGHAFEYWSADMLRNQGFQNVEVTRGSGDQGVDVLAEKDGIKYAIQCKCYSSNLGNTPVQEVHAGKDMYHCHVGVVLTNRYFTEGAKQLAEVTGTLLWDRDYIINYLSHNPDFEIYSSADTAESFSDEMIQKAIEVILETGQASVSMLERKLGLGYAASARLMEQLESRKIVGPYNSTGKPRKILIKTSACNYKGKMPVKYGILLTIFIFTFLILLVSYLERLLG